jgi:cyclopropane-fatty-acyl-phospholipid synthase
MTMRRRCDDAAVQLANGQRILELGCGWGSLSLWMAKRYPQSSITAVSNSNSQREYIQQQCKERGLTNLKIITCDMNDFSVAAEDKFDRVISLEMFEHMRNYELLLERVASWLRDNGKLFVHSFVHRQFMYEFTTDDSDDWMAKHFFTGGIMPCEQVFQQFPRHLQVQKQWYWNGRHYAATCQSRIMNVCVCVCVTVSLTVCVTWLV